MFQAATLQSACHRDWISFHALNFNCHSLHVYMCSIPCPSFLLIAEATSYRAAIRTARGVVQDLGESVASGSGGLASLAAIPEQNSERDGQKLCKRLQLALPVKMTELPRPPGTRYGGHLFVLKLEDWFRFILALNNWHVVCGLHAPDRNRERAILTRFWEWYRRYEPGHAMWKLVDENKLDTSRCAPILLHGDEGRGRKRCPFLIISWHCVLGFGTSLANSERKIREYKSMKLNYSGSTHLHRYLSGVLPKMTHDSAALQDLLKVMADSALFMMHTGLTNAYNETYFAVCLHSTGDWAWLVKAGNLCRGFGNVIKRPMTDQTNPKGICHLCCAGQRGCAFENFRVYNDGETPGWYSTLFSENPFSRPPVLSGIPFVQGKEPAFFSFDLFHSYRLGLGKCFVAGALVLASEMMDAGNVDSRFELLTASYHDFCDQAHVSPYITNLTKDTCGWPDRSTFANGQWNKGHITTALGEFFTWWASAHLRGPPDGSIDDALLRLCLQASKHIQSCLHALYSGDVWLKQNCAKRAAEDGHRFLDLYRQAATLAFRNGRALFPHMPKSHAVEHIFWSLTEQARTQEYCLSPLVTSVQISEDFVGKCSRLARRCSPMTVVQRVLERSLQASYKHWHKAGWIKH